MPKIVTDETVYAAVLQTVVENGYSGATTKQIAELADVNEATLFRKYGSKDQLVKQAIAAMVDESDIEAAIYYSGDIRADLKRVLSHAFEKDEFHAQVMICMVSEISRVPELHDVGNPQRRLILAFGQLLARYQADGTLKQEHPLHALASLVGPIVMLRLLRYANPDMPISIPDMGQHIENYLLGRLL